MNLKEREVEMRRIFEDELLKLGNAKGHDYSGDEDALSNLREFGCLGVVVRLGDKFSRLKNFYKSNKLLVKDESVEDTFKDLIIYGFLGLILHRQENCETTWVVKPRSEVRY